MTPLDADDDGPLPPLISPTDLYDVWKEEALLLADCRLTGKPIGPVTGISEIDKILTTGFRPGVHTLQGNSAAGKTAMALQIAANCRTPCLYVTCEMAPLVLLQRIGANLSGKPFYKMVDGSLMMDESLEAAELAVKKTAGHLGILDGRLQPMKVKAISAQAYSVKSLMPDCPHLLIIPLTPGPPMSSTGGSTRPPTWVSRASRHWPRRLTARYWSSAKSPKVPTNRTAKT